MEEIYSILISPLKILKKENNVLMISSDGSYSRRDSGSLKGFDEGDYLFMGKMVGKGIVEYNYIKMNDEEIKKYFPDKEEPKDRFSRFRGTSIFPE